MSKSFKQMIQEGTIKRADAMKIPFADIHVEPGFNLRNQDAEFWAGIADLKAHIKRGGQVPALEVRPRDEGGVWLVDGHRRHIAFGELIGEGDPITMISIVAFVGNDADRVARIMTSNEGAKLKPLEIAEGYRRLVAMGLSPDDIGRRVCKTRQHVDQMLLLATAPHAVQKMVADGTVKATTAIDQVRKHGEKSADVLKEAAAKTGGKVTAGQVKPWAPPAKYAGPLVRHTRALLDHIPADVLARAGSVATFDKPDEVVQIGVSLHSLFTLVQNIEVIEEARLAKEEKLRGKAGEAAQVDIESEGA